MTASSAPRTEASVNRTVRPAPRDSTSAVAVSSAARASVGRPGTMPVRSPPSSTSSTGAGRSRQLGGSAGRPAGPRRPGSVPSERPAPERAGQHAGAGQPQQRRLGEHRGDGVLRGGRARRPPDQHREHLRDLEPAVVLGQHAEHAVRSRVTHGRRLAGSSAPRRAPLSSLVPISHGADSPASQASARSAHRAAASSVAQSSARVVGHQDDGSSPSSATSRAVPATSSEHGAACRRAPPAGRRAAAARGCPDRPLAGPVPGRRRASRTSSSTSRTASSACCAASPATCRGSTGRACGAGGAGGVLRTGRRAGPGPPHVAGPRAAGRRPRAARAGAAR